MKLFKRIAFAYYWTKAEKAIQKGDQETYCKMKIKLDNIIK